MTAESWMRISSTFMSQGLGAYGLDDFVLSKIVLVAIPKHKWILLPTPLPPALAGHAAAWESQRLNSHYPHRRPRPKEQRARARHRPITDTGLVWDNDACPPGAERSPLSRLLCSLSTGMPMFRSPKCHTTTSPALSDVPVFPFSTSPKHRLVPAVGHLWLGKKFTQPPLTRSRPPGVRCTKTHSCRLWHGGPR